MITNRWIGWHRYLGVWRIVCEGNDFFDVLSLLESKTECSRVMDKDSIMVLFRDIHPESHVNDKGVQLLPESSPNRLSKKQEEIIKLLSQRPHDVTELCSITGRSNPAINSTMRLLARRGLVYCNRYSKKDTRGRRPTLWVLAQTEAPSTSESTSQQMDQSAVS